MINTIFYFPESLTFDQYLNALNSNTDDGIASRTIVFAKQLGKIYNNGKIYGTTYSDVQNLIEQNRYDDEYVRTAISNLEHDLQENSDAIDLLGRQYLAINQRLSTIENNGYVSEAQMLSTIAGELDGSTQKSSVRNKVNNVAKEASSSLFTEVSDQNNNITAQSIVDAITSNSTAKANLASSFNSGDNTMWANVLTQADLNNSSSALYAALQSKANDSEVVKKASIIASINSSGESNVKIDADKIQLNGTVIAERLMAAQAVLGGFKFENSKLSNSAVEFNADGSGYLAAGAIKWTNAGGLDINADGLLLDVTHNWSWVPSQLVKGLASFGIVGDYSNLKYKASYNFDTNEFIYDSALGNQNTGLSSDPKEATRGLANAFSSAIFDGSGLGISLLNPQAIDTQHLQDEVSSHNDATGIWLIENGINYIHPHVNLHAVLFDSSYHTIAKECTSGLHIDNNTDIGGSLLVENNVHVPNGDVAALSFKKYRGTSSLFLKADGSVDENTYLIPGSRISQLGNDVGYLTNADLSGYATTSQLAGYLPLTGGTLTGDLNMANCKLNFGTSYIDEFTIPGPNGTNQGHMLNFRGVDGNGHYDFDKSVHAESFVKLNGTSNEVLMADGSTMTLAELKAALNAI